MSSSDITDGGRTDGGGSQSAGRPPLPRRTPRSLNVFDKQFWVHNNQPAWLDSVEAGKWEPATFRAFDLLIEENSIFVDIGAWLGITVLYGATMAGEVHTFECDPVVLDVLVGSISLNPALADKITLHQVAFGTHEGSVPIYNNAPGNSGTSLVSHFGYSQEGAQAQFATARMIDGAQFLRGMDMPRVSLIKIDIEGAEYELLPHLADVIREYRPSLHLSLHPGNIDKKEDALEDRQNRIDRAVALTGCLRGYAHAYVERGPNIVQAPTDFVLDEIIDQAPEKVRGRAITLSDRDLSAVL